MIYNSNNVTNCLKITDILPLKLMYLCKSYLINHTQISKHKPTGIFRCVILALAICGVTFIMCSKAIYLHEIVFFGDWHATALYLRWSNWQFQLLSFFSKHTVVQQLEMHNVISFPNNGNHRLYTYLINTIHLSKLTHAYYMLDCS